MLPPPASTRTIIFGHRRMSVRLEAVMWEALDEIAVERGKTVHDLVVEIHRDHNEANLHSAIRVYIVKYYRDALRNVGSR